MDRNDMIALIEDLNQRQSKSFAQAVIEQLRQMGIETNADVNDNITVSELKSFVMSLLSETQQ